ncbi:MAG: hypothetical protein PHR83_07980 [Paludibacter sp.]|nr:hypothetical protein [Paludibacter sp.]
MHTDKIQFSYNWNNKLQNKAFTTIRLHNPNKYKVGNVYEIEINDNPKGTATLQDVRVLRIDQLNDFICYLDTGYNREQTINMLQRMYKNINLKTALFDFLLLVYNKPEIQAPKELQMSLEL